MNDRHKPVTLNDMMDQIEYQYEIVQAQARLMEFVKISFIASKSNISLEKIVGKGNK